MKRSPPRNSTPTGAKGGSGRFGTCAVSGRIGRRDGVTAPVPAQDWDEPWGIREISALSPIFGGAACDETTSEEKARRCALLFNVYDQFKSDFVRCRILVLKPSLLVDLPLDVRNYAINHPAFPNESTADQFFDEAQFESYRKLGLSIGQLLFGDRKMAEQTAVVNALRDHLWPRI